MSWKPKLIFTDLDGTLLNHSKELTPRNRDALKRAADQGAEVVVATGRFFGGIPKALLELPFLRYFLLMNGAKLYDRETDRVLYRAEIPMDTAQQVFRWLEPVECTVDCYQKDIGLMPQYYYDRLDFYIPHLQSRELVRRTRIPQADFCDTVRARGDSVQKIQCFFPHVELRPQIMSQLSQEFPPLIQSVSLPANLELNAPGATKGAALLALCRALQLSPQDAAAFGDGTNDSTMLQSAGMGVAMANAMPQIQAAAHRIAPSNEEDGVAVVLEEWFGA